MDVVDRLNLLQENSGMNQKDLARAIGLSLSIFTIWNKGNAKPGLKQLVKVAQYFNVSLDWLVFGDDAPSNDLENVIKLDFSSQSEKELIDKFRELPDNYQKNVLAYIDGIASTLPKTESDDTKKLSV